MKIAGGHIFNSGGNLQPPALNDSPAVDFNIIPIWNKLSLPHLELSVGYKQHILGNISWKTQQIYNLQTDYDTCPLHLIKKDNNSALLNSKMKTSCRYYKNKMILKRNLDKDPYESL